jgi:hypothetical protein
VRGAGIFLGADEGRDALGFLEFASFILKLLLTESVVLLHQHLRTDQLTILNCSLDRVTLKSRLEPVRFALEGIMSPIFHWAVENIISVQTRRKHSKINLFWYV